MKLFLHVGPHKTGTTLLQKVFLDNQYELLKQGLFYPKQFLHIFGHHKFRDKISSLSITKEDVEFFKSSGTNVFLSSEDFISLNEEQFIHLREAFSDFEVEIIYSWRRASKKLYSIWQEVIKHGGVESFFSYHTPHLAKPGSSAMLSPDIKLNMFSRVFGKEHVHIVDYDSAVSNDDLLSQLYKLVGLRQPEKLIVSKGDKTATNASLDFTNIEIIRTLNRLFSERDGVEGQTVRNAFLQNSDEKFLKLVDKLSQSLQNYQFEFDLNALFVDIRAEKLMLGKYASQIQNYQVPKPNKPVVLIDSDWLLNDSLRALLEELYLEVKSSL